MITKILEALEKYKLQSLPIVIQVLDNTNTQIDEYEQDGRSLYSNSEKLYRKHYLSLKSIMIYERTQLVIITIEGVQGSFMLNLSRGTAVYNSKMKSSKATERLIYKQLLPPDLTLKYLEKIEHICPLSNFHERVQLELSKRLNSSANSSLNDSVEDIR